MAIADRLYKIIREKRSSGSEERRQRSNVKLSGTTQPIQMNDTGEGELGPAIGRTQAEHQYPDFPRPYTEIETANGDRLQDMTSRHLHEGPTPGRIPYIFGRKFSGNVGSNDALTEMNFLPISITGSPAGGIAGDKYIPHVVAVRPAGTARPAYRTVDDAAAIPGVFVQDATRR